MLEYLTSLPNITLPNILSTFFLTLFRLAPIMVMAPFLGSKLAPGIARTGLAIFLAILFVPHVILTGLTPISFNSLFILYTLKEVFIGFILGLMISVPFYMIQSSGIIVDFMRGASMMQAQDPSMQVQSSTIGIFYNYILIVIFFKVNGPVLFFKSVLLSYDIIPANSFINPAFFQTSSQFWDYASNILNTIFAIAIQMSAPAILAILMAEMFLGIANRMAPQVQIAFLGMSLKSFLGLALLTVGWFFILKQFSKQSINALDQIETMINTIKLL